MKKLILLTGILFSTSLFAADYFRDQQTQYGTRDNQSNPTYNPQPSQTTHPYSRSGPDSTQLYKDTNINQEARENYNQNQQMRSNYQDSTTTPTSSYTTYNDSRNDDSKYDISTKQNIYANDQFNTEQDRQIAKSIRDSIKGGWFSKGFDDIAIRVDNGNVILRGTVEDPEDIRKIEKKVSKIDGVRNLRTQITVLNQNDARGNYSNPQHTHR